MRAFLAKIFTWGLLLSLAMFGIGAWETFKEKNVSTELTSMNMENMTNPTGEPVYAEITGGQMDIGNIYTYSTSSSSSPSDFYVPVMNGDTLSYIAKLNQEPTPEQMVSEAKFTGLFQGASEMPSDLLDAYDGIYTSGAYFYLDTEYEPKPLTNKLLKLGLFLVAAIVFFFLRKFFSPRAVPMQRPVDESTSE